MAMSRRGASPASRGNRVNAPAADRVGAITPRRHDGEPSPADLQPREGRIVPWLILDKALPLLHDRYSSPSVRAGHRDLLQPSS
jgi:hypothetical protein